ncbi:MAG: class I SAM-dependent methyltransferase [Planctomycetia bacterium]|nr:class I SAM-dependent methyltransferase [Planctomycetia bacterium]
MDKPTTENKSPFFSDLKTIFHLVCYKKKGKNHADRLDQFYGAQADNYDRFRNKLLKGREQLWKTIGAPPNSVWADMGGGTGSNLAFLGNEIHDLRKGYVVDLASSLLKVAQQRIENNHWNNIETVHADATTWVPAEKSLDVITFSYSLTMIPDWFAAIDHAYSLLKPGGKIGVVDFYLSRKFPLENNVKHGWATRSFWPLWFAFDNVFPSTEHVPYLLNKFKKIELIEEKARVPYFPLFWWKMPYYIFVGQKTE